MKSVRPLQWLRVRERQVAVAAALLGVFLSLLVLAASAALHHEVHSDAAEHDHQCAVTLISAGQMDAPPLFAPVTPPVAVLLSSLPHSETPLVSADLRLMPGRGPPVSR
jgi:hypothetical protein